MNKFEELCKMYAASRRRYFDYKKSLYDFAVRLADGFGDYLQCPKTQVRCLPSTEEIKPNTKYTIAGAMKLENDTYWHLGIGLTLDKSPNCFPQETLLLSVLLKKVDDYFNVKLGSKEEEFKIHESNKEEFNAFYDFIFEQIKDTFEKELQRFLEQDEPIRKIGF